TSSIPGRPTRSASGVRSAPTELSPAGAAAFKGPPLLFARCARGPAASSPSPAMHPYNRGIRKRRRSRAMQLMWRYIQPLRGWVALSLLLAAVAQVLTLVDPLIFGHIIDEYALNPHDRPQSELVRGALGWLLVAAGVALAARLAKAFQDYVLALVVQRFGLRIFNDGLRQALRLTYEAFEDHSRGETIGLLQKVRNDTQRFINSAVNVLFSSLVGLVFLTWYAVTKHWLLIPVFVVGVLLLGAMSSVLSRRMREVQRAVVRETAGMSGTMTESLRNIELVKSLGLTWPEIRRLERQTHRIFDLEMEKTRKVRTLSVVQATLINKLR